MNATPELLARLQAISNDLDHLAKNTAGFALDIDAIVDLNMARESVDKLINRVERILE